MNKRREISNVNFFGSLVILAGLLVSLGFPTQTKIAAKEIVNSHETVLENKTGLKQTGYGKMPLLFEENKGQTDRQAKFISRGNGYTLYLTATEAVFQLRATENDLSKESENLRLRFTGANTKPTIEGEAEAVTKTNYYIGKKKFENLPNYERVNYRNLYQGIDAVFYGNASNQLEYDFAVAPNADPNKIALDFDGEKDISIDAQGNLVIKTENSELVQQKPIAYQTINGEKREIEARYVINSQSQIANRKSQISFALGEYDKTQPLTIDPEIGYLTYLGGSGAEIATDIKVDSAGNAFVVGSSNSINFPGPNAGSGNTKHAAYVTKISPDGSTILYTTFLDGSENDGQNAFNIGVVRPDLAIDSAGNAYIAGGTDSGDFPVTSNAYQTTRGCARQFFVCIEPEEGFVAKLNPQGGVVYSTFLGGRGADYLNSIAVDSSGRAYVTGGTRSGFTFPTKNEFQGTGFFGGELDAFLTVLNSDGSDIVYSTALGGSDSDQGNEIALDSSNNVYIVGSTTSSEDSFPLRNSFQSSNGGGRDMFVAKFNTSLSGDSSLIYSSMIGGAGTDEGFGITVDENNFAYVTGITGSFNYPLQNAFRSTNQINEAFVTVLSSTGNNLIHSSFLGGSNQEEGRDIALGSGGLIYVTGNTLSSDFPAAGAFQPTIGGGRDAFIATIRFGIGVMSASFLGGNDFDSGDGIAVRGNRIFLTGSTTSNNLATTGGVAQPNFGGSADGFIAQIIDTHTDSVGVFRPAATFLLTQSTTNVVSQTATFTSGISGQKGVSGDWNGDGITTIGSFTNGTWKVRDVNFPSINVIFTKTITFGTTGDLPVVGDWNGDGIDTPGVYRIVNGQGQFTLTNSTSATPSFFVFVIKVNFGLAGDLPIAGDWDGDGIDSVGVFRPSAGNFFLTDENILNPPIDQSIFFGTNGDLPIGGDWDGNGVDTVGVWRPSTAEFFLSNDNININRQFIFGAVNTDQPIAGDWDGKP